MALIIILCLIGIISALVELAEKLLSEDYKIYLAWGKFIITGVLLGIVILFFNKSDSDQKTRIESLARKDSSLAYHDSILTTRLKYTADSIDVLSDSIHDLDSRISNLTVVNNHLSSSIYNQGGHIKELVVSTDNLLVDTKNLISTNDEITKNFITGGDSYPFAHILRVNDSPDYIILNIENKGKYPIYELGYTIIDDDLNKIYSYYMSPSNHKWSSKVADSLDNEEGKEIEREHNLTSLNHALQKGMSWTPDTIPINLNYMVGRTFEIHFVCRSGKYTQLIEYRNGQTFSKLIRNSDNKVMLDTVESSGLKVFGAKHLKIYPN